jgi:hypothetical protein
MNGGGNLLGRRVIGGANRDLHAIVVVAEFR